MIEPEFVVQALAHGPADVGAVRAAFERDVNGERVEAVGDSPDVEIMQPRTPGQARIARSTRSDIEIRRRALSRIPLFPSRRQPLYAPARRSRRHTGSARWMPNKTTASPPRSLRPNPWRP